MIDPPRPAKQPRHRGLRPLLLAGEESMRRISVASALAVVAVAGSVPGAAGTEDPFKSGKWEISATAPGERLPPGMPPSPGVRDAPEGVTFSRTACITVADPLPPMARGPSTPTDPSHPCKIDRTAVAGGMVNWSMTCVTPQVTIREVGFVHYHGVMLDGKFTLSSARPGQPPIEKTQILKGRYLGPCDGK
jgi:hypothetical protein